MKPERWKQIEELFNRLVNLDEPGRVRLLDQACAGDPQLRSTLIELLASDQRPGGALGEVDRPPMFAPPDPLLGTILGAYRLVARLAVGGMGVVYEGERCDGLFEQQVAIKLIRPERTTPWLLKRFEFERRTLAGLQHPAIARLYAGGATADGCPYFVMELVRGESLLRYCERERSSLAARLALFVEVCGAVHFAHQNLVVHCDLKPANILIDSRGRPRLLDFGIARLLEDQPQEAAAEGTRTLARVLTPEYASPEQWLGGPLTTAVDVYALGVILYELLTGKRPFDSQGRSPAEWERLVLERSPERPSTCLKEPAQLAQARAESLQSTPARLRRALRGDLDRIVLMALRKEPERRYRSVQALIDDLERYLAGLPVVARGDAVGYRVSKFVQRNRLAIAAVVAIVGALLFGLISARRGQRLAAAEAVYAQLEADSFHSIADFLMDAFLPAQPAQDAVWQARAKDLILTQVGRVERQYARQEHVRANLLEALGQVCLRIDLRDEGRTLLHSAAEIRALTFGPASLEYALSLRSLGQSAYEFGDFDQAVTWLEQALAIQRANASSKHADVASLANDLAACLHNLGRDDQAERLHLEALQLRRAAGGPSLPIAESLNNLAGLHLGQGQLERAAAEFEEALQLRAEILGSGHLLTLQVLSNLATCRWHQNQPEQAETLLKQAEAGYLALAGDGEEGLGTLLSNLAAIQLARNDLETADSTLQRALELQRRRLGPQHPGVAVTLAKLAVLQHSRGLNAEARELWEQVLTIRRAEPESVRDLADARYGQGVFLLDMEELEAARAAFEECLGWLAESKEPLLEGRIEAALALCHERLDQLPTARIHWANAAQLLTGTPGVTAAELERIQRRLGGPKPR